MVFSMNRKLISFAFLILIVPNLVTTFAEAPSTSDEDFLSARVSAAETWLAENADVHVQRLIQFLSFQSVSSDPARSGAVRDAAEWLLDELSSAGMQKVQLLESSRHPTVYAEWKTDKDENAPTVLLYAHYDVQPEDPISEWKETDDPFKAKIKGNRIYARGASDDKGHLYTVVAALRAWLRDDKSPPPPLNLKVLFEGEEEIGSPNLKAILDEHKDLLQADFAFSADGGMVDEKTPSICVSLRGAIAYEINIAVANSDMHSGTYGGGVMNPVFALAYLLSKMRDEKTGRALIDGFYDPVIPMSEETRADIKENPIAIEDVLRPLSVNESVGEDGYNFRERTLVRPSIDVLGVYGGFQGEGVKTVLPREVTVKMSSRIVADQTAEEIMQLIEAHVTKVTKHMKGIRVRMHNLGFSSEPVNIPKQSAGNAAATAVLKTLYDRDPVYLRFGGSIPALGLLRKKLGIVTSMFSFALSDENVHAPDEFARIDQLRRSEVAYVRLFAEILRRHNASQGKSKEEL